MYNLPDWKCWVIYNGVAYRKFDGHLDPGGVKARLGIGPTDPTVLYCGRMTLQKGPDLLLEAVPGLLRHYPNTKFIFAGEGHLRGSLEQRARQLNVNHAVRWFGMLNSRQHAEFFKSSDAVCVPSRNEPFGIVVLEAWSASKPVVASNHGGPAEFVWHNVNGLRIYPTVESVGWGLGTLFTNWDWARWMGRNGRAAVETTFTWDRIADTTLQCYQS